MGETHILLGLELVNFNWKKAASDRGGPGYSIKNRHEICEARSVGDLLPVETNLGKRHPKSLLDFDGWYNPASQPTPQSQAFPLENHDES